MVNHHALLDIRFNQNKSDIDIDHAQLIRETHAQTKRDPSSTDLQSYLIRMCLRVLQVWGKVRASDNNSLVPPSLNNLWNEQNAITAVIDSMVEEPNAEKCRVLFKVLEIFDLSSTEAHDNVVRIFNAVNFESATQRYVLPSLRMLCASAKMFSLSKALKRISSLRDQVHAIRSIRSRYYEHTPPTARVDDWATTHLAKFCRQMTEEAVDVRLLAETALSLNRTCS